MPVWSRWYNWNADITTQLPFVLFTQAQYEAFGNTAGTGIILGRVALADSPTTFLSGATITAREYTPGNPPVLGATYPVTYTSGSVTQADGIFTVKNVPAETLVQLTATLEGYTFEFNNSVVPAGAATITEESFFAESASGEELQADVLYMRRTNGYQLEFMLEGDVTDISSVTVTGPSSSSITNFNLPNRESDEFWGVYPSESNAIASGFPDNFSGTYTFTATSGSGDETFTFDFQPGEPLTVPANISVNEETGMLSWDAVTGAAGYYLIINSGSEEVYNGEANTPISQSPFDLFTAMGQGSADAGYYTVTVVAVDSAFGNEAYAGPVSFLYSGGSTGTLPLFYKEADFKTALPGETLIDFNDIDTSAGTVAFSGNEYSAQGITFASPNSQALKVAPPPEYNWEWGSNYLSPGALPWEGGDSNEDSLTLTFSPSVGAIGWTFLDMPNTTVPTIRVYDAGDNLIHETLNGSGLISSGDESYSAFWGIVSPDTPIARVEIIDPQDNGDDVGYDNFIYSTSGEICTYEFSSVSANLSASGGSLSFEVTCGTGCAWTAKSTTSSWLHITEGGSTGPGTVSFSVDLNTGAARSGNIIVGGNAFIVNQEAAPVHSEADGIQAQFEAAMARYNAGDFSEETGFASFISDSFLDCGEDRTMFLAEALEDYDESAPMTWTIDRITGTGENAIINLTWGDNQKDMLYFHKEGSVWMLYGNQQIFDAWANSGHQMYSDNTHPYWVSLDVQDRDGLTINSVNVNGPNLPSEGIALYHDEQSGIWHSWSSDPWVYDDLNPKWASQPSVPLEYIFTVNYSDGSETLSITQVYTINSFVNDAPPQASISPAADTIATRPLVFSWDSAGDGYRYRVEINDLNFNRIWDSDDLTETSLTYNGPPLGGGQYYFSLITEDGYESISMVNTPFELPLLYQRTPVTTGPGRDDHPAWSPDGSKIAFTSDRSGTNNIWVINPDGSGLKQLTSFTGYQSASYPSFSPDGTKIAFIMTDTDPTLTIWQEACFIYTMNPDGTGQTIQPLTPGTSQDPTDQFWENSIIFTEWLDNDRIMFVSYGPDGGSMKFYKHTLSADLVEQVVPSPVEENDSGEIYKISWNAVLGKLAFDRWPIGIQTMADTGAGYQILNIRNNGQMDTPGMPGWKADGSKIAFVKDVYNLGNIGIFDLTTEDTITEQTETADTWPVWSPDGEAIAFVSNGKIALMSLTHAVKGDLNNDEKVDLNDAILALKILSGQGSAGIRPWYSTSGADVDGDGKVGSAEVIYILRHISGLGLVLLF